MLLLGFVGCANSPCSGDSCLTAETVDETSPTSEPVAAETGSGPAAAASSSAAETADDLPQCRIDEDCHDQAPVCSENRQCVACLDDGDCSPTRPYCKVSADEKHNHCVACQNGADCGDVGDWECIAEQCFESCDVATNTCGAGLVCVSNEGQTIQYCAECSLETPCADPSLVCVNSRCLGCNPVENTGCSEGQHCEQTTIVTPDGDAGLALQSQADPTRCVDCRVGVAEDCPEGTCVDGECRSCDPATHAGCGGEAPVCKPSEDGPDEAVCVECISPADCENSPAGLFCVANRCAVCDPQDNNGCSGQLAACVDIAPPSATDLFECRECLDTCPNNEVCVGFECVECATALDCAAPQTPECTPQNTCAPCTTHEACKDREATPYCDASSGQCVACLQDAHCADTPDTPACRTSTSTCVQCTSSAHCPGNPGGCLTFPGPGEYTCAPEGTEPVARGECSRCHAGQCATGLVCAGPPDNARCMPRVESNDPCGPHSLPLAEDSSSDVLVCVPEACADDVLGQ